MQDKEKETMDRDTEEIVKLVGGMSTKEDDIVNALKVLGDALSDSVENMTKHIREVLGVETEGRSAKDIMQELEQQYKILEHKKEIRELSHVSMRDFVSNKYKRRKNKR